MTKNSFEVSNKICWVTGAFGFIGRRIGKELSQRGFQVLGLGHGHWPASESKRWGIESWLDGDLTASNLNFLRSKGGKPTAIFHLAGGSSVGAAFQNPLEDFNRTTYATAELLEWVRQESPNTRLVVASTAAVYGDGSAGQIKESQATVPFSIYGYNKLAMENLCRSYGFNYGLETAIARIFSVYGAGLKKQLMWDICSKLSEDATVLRLGGTGEEIRDWIHVDDTVVALTKLITITSDKTPVINVGTGIGTSVRSIAEKFIERWNAGISNTQCHLVFDGNQRAGDPFSLIADICPLNALGIQPSRQIDAEISAFVDWYKKTDTHL